MIDPPTEVVEWLDTLKALPVFASFTAASGDDKKKNSQYKAKAAFESETKQFNNYNDFLSNINMDPTIIEISESTIGRAVQLCQKTNQMNLRLARHDEVSLQKITHTKRSVSFLIQLKDKFGDHGIIALVIARPTEISDTAFLDTFLMSCRVLGRNIEGWIFENIRSRLLANGFQHLKAEYTFGERNSPARNLLNDYGFFLMKTAENESVKTEEYTVALADWHIANLEIFNIKSH